MVANLQKERKQWFWISLILGWEGAYPWTYGNFYNAVVQVTLLFGVEVRVVSLRIVNTLARFHHRVARSLEIIFPRMDTMSRWV